MYWNEIIIDLLLNANLAIAIIIVGIGKYNLPLELKF